MGIDSLAPATRSQPLDHRHHASARRTGISWPMTIDDERQRLRSGEPAAMPGAAPPPTTEMRSGRRPTPMRAKCGTCRLRLLQSECAQVRLPRHRRSRPRGPGRIFPPPAVQGNGQAGPWPTTPDRPEVDSAMRPVGNPNSVVGIGSRLRFCPVCGSAQRGLILETPGRSSTAVPYPREVNIASLSLAQSVERHSGKGVVVRQCDTASASRASASPRWCACCAC